MKYYDQHLHTYFSFDSEEKFEHYLTSKPQTFVTTEHFDLRNPLSHFSDDIPDYAAYNSKLAKLQEAYSTHFLRGIEIGIIPGQEQQITDYLATRPYDLKLLSIHQNGQYDFMDDIVLTKDKFIVAQDYFSQMEQVLDTFHEGDILTHFDYGLRRFNFSATELQEQFESQLIRIFKKVLERGMVFELNAKSFVKYQNQKLYEYVVSLFISLGGKEFSLGSDAHIAKDYQLGFDEMSALLRKYGVSQLVVVQNKEHIFTNFPE